MMSQSDNIRRSCEDNKIQKTQTSPTFEQLLHGEDALWSSTSSPTVVKNHDAEEYTSNYLNKKSVLAKVKQTAKKLKHTLSGKKKQGIEPQDDNHTPSWGVSLDDLDEDEDEDDDPEYLGAPMYESELAPETCREYHRQHPRAIPVVSEKHVLSATLKRENNEQEREKLMNENKTMTRSVSLKVAPTHRVTSKFSGLKISTPEAEETTGKHVNRNAVSDPGIADVKKLSGSPAIGKQSSESSQKWDKGVSVKEYFLNKLEPGDDERALSQAITDAISPRKIAGDTGVVEMVKEAVASFFRSEETSNSNMPKKNTPKTEANSSSPTLLASPKPSFTDKKEMSSSSSPTPRVSFYANANAPAKVPVSTNAHPVPEEESHGRILQTN